MDNAASLSGSQSQSGIHPAPAGFTEEQIGTDPILHFFHFAHLPAALQAASKPFCALALHIVETLPRNAERTVALRKLLEAKDAAVRANVGPVTQARPEETFIDRLKREHADLKSKVDKLGQFLANGTPTVSDEQAELLDRQHTHMLKYLNVLSMRLIDLGEMERPAEDDEAARIGEPVEFGGHDEDRDGPVPFGG